jgi:hypothetical protein
MIYGLKPRSNGSGGFRSEAQAALPDQVTAHACITSAEGKPDRAAIGQQRHWVRHGSKFPLVHRHLGGTWSSSLPGSHEVVVGGATSESPGLVRYDVMRFENWRGADDIGTAGLIQEGCSGKDVGYDVRHEDFYGARSGP